MTPSCLLHHSLTFSWSTIPVRWSMVQHTATEPLYNEYIQYMYCSHSLLVAFCLANYKGSVESQC